MIIELEPGAQALEYATIGAAGADLHAYLPDGPVSIDPGKHVLISTGMKVQLPQGLEMQIRPRSGLALKYGVTVLNAPGTIDSDYRGTIGVILINHGDRPYRVEHGDRIAQAVIASYEMGVFNTGIVDQTARGSGGFGHTGVGALNG